MSQWFRKKDFMEAMNLGSRGKGPTAWMWIQGIIKKNLGHEIECSLGSGERELANDHDTFWWTMTRLILCKEHAMWMNEKIHYIPCLYFIMPWFNAIWFWSSMVQTNLRWIRIVLYEIVSLLSFINRISISGSQNWSGHYLKVNQCCPIKLN